MRSWKLHEHSRPATISNFLFCFLSCSLAFPATTLEPPKLRLPTNVRPIQYGIDLTIVPGQDNFKGSADIDIDVQQPASVVWLNAEELKIEEASWNLQDRAVPAKVVAGNKGFVGFSFEQAVVGRGVLHVTYEGRITRNSSAGVFQLQDGKQWYVYTQFGQLTHGAPFRAVAESAGTDGLKTVRIAETKPLPSYLVAMGVGPFDTEALQLMVPTRFALVCLLPGHS